VDGIAVAERVIIKDVADGPIRPVGETQLLHPNVDLVV
jgi:hypothetical protein